MPTLTATAQNAGCNAIVDLMNSGTIEFQASGGDEVATCTFGATAFGDATAGVATANAITDDETATGGTVDHAVIYESDGSTDLMECTCTTTGGGGDFEFTSLVIGAGDTVSVTAMTITLPASA